MELIGRARELEFLDRALADVRAGGTRALALVGEAGIGKSALLDALTERADGLRVLRGRAAEHEREVPFALAADAFGEVSLESGPAAARLRTHRVLAAQLARVGPAALLLDDLHWADDASLELLDHLIRRPPEAPHLLVVTARPGTCLPQLDVLTLGPLDRAASLALVASARPASEHEAIVAAAGGNPLYLRELARAAGSDGRPHCLLDVVRRETGSLAAVAAALLAGAAVAGDPFDPELAAAAAGIAPDAAALDELCARDLIRPTGNGRLFGFRHLLLRHCVYDTIPPARRLDAHERAAAALAARGAGLAARAYHVERCGRAGDPAATALLRDAAAAVARTAPATAARWYEAALRLLGDEPSVRAELLAPMGLALAAAGRFEAAREALDEAYALAPSIEVAVACARVDSELGRYADARRRLQPEQHRPQVALELAAIAFHEGVLSDLATWAEPARRATAPAPATRPTTSNRPRGARARLAPAARPAAPNGPSPRRRAGAVRARCGLDRRARPCRRRCSNRRRRRWTPRSTPNSPPTRAPRCTSPPRSCCSCVWRTANARSSACSPSAMSGSPCVSGSRARWPASSAARSTTRSRTSTPARSSRASRRRRDRCTSRCGCARSSSTSAGTPMRPPARRASARRSPRRCSRTSSCAPEGAPPPSWAPPRIRTGPCATPPRSWARRSTSPTAHGRAGCCCASCARRSRPGNRTARSGGRGSRATARGSRWRSPAPRSPRPSSRWPQATRPRQRERRRTGGHAARGCRRRPLGTVAPHGGHAARGGRRRSAARLAASAATIADDVGAVLDALDARLLEARALAAAGRTDVAKDVLQRITVDAAHRRAFRLRDAAARELRALGTRVASAGQRASGGALTDREREITALVAAGRSNRQVAETLFLSEKTVANALTRISGRGEDSRASSLMCTWELWRPHGRRALRGSSDAPGEVHREARTGRWTTIHVARELRRRLEVPGGERRERACPGSRATTAARPCCGTT